MDINCFVNKIVEQSKKVQFEKTGKHGFELESLLVREISIAISTRIRCSYALVYAA